MNNTYLAALKESLEKKIEVLKDIHIKDEEQLEITKATPFSYDKYDRNAEEKGVLIYKLEKLDDGFEEELNANKDAYKNEIREMQELISEITSLSTKIQAEEARNKKALEAAFKSEKERLKGQRSGVKAVKSYAQSMQASGSAYSGLMDQKKYRG